MKPIKYLTIHCAATPEGRNIPANHVNRWALDRFKQPSYHIVIELDGSYHRFLDDDERGAHVGGHNTGNIGICYVGGMDADFVKAKDTRTKEQKETLRTLVRTYLERYPGIQIKGHREWPNVAKDCPSFDVGAWLEAGMPI